MTRGTSIDLLKKQRIGATRESLLSLGATMCFSEGLVATLFFKSQDKRSSAGNHYDESCNRKRKLEIIAERFKNRGKFSVKT